MINCLNMDPNNDSRVAASIFALAHPQAPVRATAEAYLQDLLSKNIGQLLHQIFSMIRSSDAKTNLMAIAYLRHLLHTQRSRFPDIGSALADLYAQKKDKQIAQLFQVFINKPQHMRYKKEFCSQIISQLGIQVSQGILNERLMQFIISAFGTPLQSMSSKLGMGSVPTSFIGFVNQFSYFEPSNLVDRHLWINTLISMSNFSGIPPPMSFIYRNLMRSPPLPTLLNLIYFYNRVHARMTNIQQIYGLIIRNMNLTANNEIIDQISMHSSQGLQVFLMHIRLLLGDAFELTLSINRENTGQVIILEHLESRQICMHYIKFFTYVLENYGSESKQITDISIQFMRTLSENIPSQKLTVYLRQFQNQLSTNQQTIYYLLSAMPRFVLEMFNATKLLINQITNLFSQPTRNVSPIFLQFVRRYVKVYQYFPNSQIQMAIHRFSETICSSQLCGVTTMEPFKLKAQGLVILSQLQKFCIDKSRQTKQQFCRQFLWQLMNVLTQMSQANILQNSSEVVQILMEAVDQLISIPLNSPILNSQLVSYLIPAFEQNMSKDQMHILSHLIHFIKVTFEFSRLTPLIFQIVSLCLYSKNQALQTEGCELFLKIVYEINREVGVGKCSEQMEMIKKCGIFDFIGHKLNEGEDEVIYSKILIQLVIHEQVYRAIVGVLEGVSNREDMDGFGWHFDKVWQGLVIMWNVENGYTKKKGINEKIEQIRGGNCEKMLQSLSVEEKDIYIRELENELNKVHWCRLPDVKCVIEVGSTAAAIIESRLNQIL